jgi:hypothetical protein
VRRPVNVWVRADRVEAQLERASLHRDATRIAGQLGVDSDTLVRDAQMLVTRARAAGASTWEQIIAWTATELGIDVDALRAETERLAAMRVR